MLVDKIKPDEKFKVDLFILVARSEFFRSLASSPMLETQEFTSQFSLTNLHGEAVSIDVFKMFV